VTHRIDEGGAKRDVGGMPGERARSRPVRLVPRPPSCPPRISERSTILFLAANPAGTSHLRLDEEARDIASKVRGALHRDSFAFRTWWALRPDDLQQALLDEAPTVLHFSGHGEGVCGIVLHGESGAARSVSADALRDLLIVLKDNIRVVVLNACYSAQQAEAIVGVVDVVIGMTASVSDAASRAFAAAFYRALGAGRSVGNAFDLGVNAIRLEGLDNDQAAPVMLERLGVHADELVLVSPREVQGGSGAGDRVAAPPWRSWRLRRAALLGLSIAGLAASIAWAVT
jgi:hypothetical protein